MTNDAILHSELGKATHYDSHYNPDRLHPIPRAASRQAIGIDPTRLPFVGFDCWTHYEVSWLNTKGKPMVAIAEIFYDCHSPNIIESKSLKLYFNSLNDMTFESIDELTHTLEQDLSHRVGSTVAVHIKCLHDIDKQILLSQMDGTPIDQLDIECDIYDVDSTLLTTHDMAVTETLCSNLLRSNCPVTNQPDWGSVQIQYQGPQIDRANLLRYLVSFRHHNDFHEQCIERIFVDIMTHCQPKQLTVYGRYTRRGGLDINPYRSTDPLSPLYQPRLIRQ